MNKRLRVPITPLAEGAQELPREAGHYVAVVHRLAVGDEILLFDPTTGLEAMARIDAVAKKAVTATVGIPTMAPAPRGPRVHLFQALGKGDKFDGVVRDATELGVHRIVPILTARTQVREAAKRDRWMRIAIEAARQSERSRAPSIEPPVTFEEAIATVTQGILFDPRGESRLRDAIESPTDDIALFIGPEGGFTDEECNHARAHGIAVTRLGNSILRTETMCAAAMGALLALVD